VNWQLIDTAPLDKQILLHTKKGRIVIGFSSNILTNGIPCPLYWSELARNGLWPLWNDPPTHWISIVYPKEEGSQDD